MPRDFEKQIECLCVQAYHMKLKYPYKKLEYLLVGYFIVLIYSYENYNLQALIP